MSIEWKQGLSLARGVSRYTLDLGLVFCRIENKRESPNAYSYVIYGAGSPAKWHGGPIADSIEPTLEAVKTLAEERCKRLLTVMLKKLE